MDYICRQGLTAEEVQVKVFETISPCKRHGALHYAKLAKIGAV